MLAAGPGTFEIEYVAGVATPVTLPVTEYEPAVVLAVNTVAVASPLLFVVAVIVASPPHLPVAPLDGAVNVTVTPLTGLLEASRTTALKFVAKALPTCALCGVPAVAVTLAAGPAVLVKAKFAGVATPDAVADTVYVPAVPFAVKTAAVAKPLAFVVAVFTPPANVPLAPVRGALNVTVMPFTGLVNASWTITCMFKANADPTCALCGVPTVVAIVEAAPAAFVSENVAGDAMPVTDAVTEYAPDFVFAVNVGAVANPLPFVVAETELSPPANVPVAIPVPLGAVNVTDTPLTGLFPASTTFA